MDKLASIKNRGGDRIYNPIAFVVSQQVHDSIQQREYLDWPNNKYPDLEISVVEPKYVKGELVDCSDAQIISFICMALYSPNIHEIFIISGDGDCRIPLETIGINGKKIHVVGAFGAISHKLSHLIGNYGGKVHIIKTRIPGIMPIEADSVAVIA